MAIYQQIFYHIYELSKQVYNKKVKPQNYTLGNKVWLSSKYLKTKRNCKLKARFFDLF